MLELCLEVDCFYFYFWGFPMIVFWLDKSEKYMAINYISNSCIKLKSVGNRSKEYQVLSSNL